MIKQEIQSLIKDAIASLKLPATKITLDHPTETRHGDYSTNVALVLAKDAKKSPKGLAEEIATKIRNSKLEIRNYIDEVKIAGPGFINFYLTEHFLTNELNNVLKDKNQYGSNQSAKGKKVIVEFSSPNIAKPFTVGHLRSTIIGDAIANILSANGWRVMKDNHLGDWGTQFGKQIYAVKTWGNLEEISKSKKPVEELVKLYVRFHEEAEKDPSLEEEGRKWFKKLEDGDQEARELWQKCVDWSWKEFNIIYQKLNITFSKEFNDGRGLGEAFFEDKMTKVVKELEDKKLLKSGKEGAKLVFFPDEKYPPAMIIKKDGATLYHTRDLATDKYRLETYNPNLIINEVGIEQQLYFQQLFEMEKMLGWYKGDQRVHIAHGLFRFTEGKMSTRKGNVIWLAEVLDEAVSRAKKLQSEPDDKLAEAVGIGALKYNDLRRDPKGDIVFNWDEILNMQGNSGPYLQYTFARATSVIKNQDYSLPSDHQPNQEEKAVLTLIYRFSEVVLAAGEQYTTHLICNYLFELAQTFNTFYNKHSILTPTLKGDAESIKNFRLALTASVAQVLKNGLNLLGIKAPEKM